MQTKMQDNMQNIEEKKKVLPFCNTIIMMICRIVRRRGAGGGPRWAGPELAGTFFSSFCPPSGILTTWHIPSYTHKYSVYDPISHALSYGVIYRVYRGINVSRISVLSYIPVYTFPKRIYRHMTVYDGIGISRYMMVHARHMSLNDKYSVLILVMATDVSYTDIHACFIYRHTPSIYHVNTSIWQHILGVCR
jgi:hypothetical protein